MKYNRPLGRLKQVPHAQISTIKKSILILDVTELSWKCNMKSVSHPGVKLVLAKFSDVCQKYTLLEVLLPA